MTGTQIAISPESPYSEDALHCIAAYYRELDARFEGGFSPHEGGYAKADEPASFLIVRYEGRPVGCGALHLLDGETGEIKQMWVAPEMRGRGIARLLLEALETEARELELQRILLDTNRSLTEAQSLYFKAGYVEVERYNDNAYADMFFEKTLED